MSDYPTLNNYDWGIAGAKELYGSRRVFNRASQARQASVSVWSAVQNMVPVSLLLNGGKRCPFDGSLFAESADVMPLTQNSFSGDNAYLKEQCTQFNLIYLAKLFDFYRSGLGTDIDVNWGWNSNVFGGYELQVQPQIVGQPMSPLGLYWEGDPNDPVITPVQIDTKYPMITVSKRYSAAQSVPVDFLSRGGTVNATMMSLGAYQAYEPTASYPPNTGQVSGIWDCAPETVLYMPGDMQVMPFEIETLDGIVKYALYSFVQNFIYRATEWNRFFNSEWNAWLHLTTDLGQVVKPYALQDAVRIGVDDEPEFIDYTVDSMDTILTGLTSELELSFASSVPLLTDDMVSITGDAQRDFSRHIYLDGADWIVPIITNRAGTANIVVNRFGIRSYLHTCPVEVSESAFTVLTGLDDYGTTDILTLIFDRPMLFELKDVLLSGSVSGQYLRRTQDSRVWELYVNVPATETIDVSVVKDGIANPERVDVVKGQRATCTGIDQNGVSNLVTTSQLVFHFDAAVLLTPADIEFPNIQILRMDRSGNDWYVSVRTLQTVSGTVRVLQTANSDAYEQEMTFYFASGVSSWTAYLDGVEGGEKGLSDTTGVMIATFGTDLTADWTTMYSSITIVTN